MALEKGTDSIGAVKSFWGNVVGWLFYCAGASSATVDVIDQRHDWEDAFEGSHSIQSLAPIVQEFTPAVGALDFVEVWTHDFGRREPGSAGAVVQVLLRERAVEGTLLAASMPVTLTNDWNGVSRFYFSNTVWLEPGRTYALGLRVVTGDNWGVVSYGDLFPELYAGGRYYLAGTPTEQSDMWFRTGVRVPEPSLSLAANRLRWQGIPPLNYRLWSSMDLRNWTHVATVSSSTTNYFFSNVPGDANRLFFRLSYP